MATVNKYRIRCTTDNVWEYVLGTVEPTACPTNGAHTVDTISISTVKRDILVNDGTVSNLPPADYKQLRYREIDIRTIALIEEGFIYDSQIFSLSIKAQTNWNELKNNEVDLTWPVEISTLNNDSYSLAQTNLFAFLTVFYDVKNSHLDSGRTLKKNIFDVVDSDAVDLILDTR